MRPVSSGAFVNRDSGLALASSAAKTTSAGRNMASSSHAPIVEVNDEEDDEHDSDGSNSDEWGYE